MAIVRELRLDRHTVAPWAAGILGLVVIPLAVAIVITATMPGLTRTVDPARAPVVSAASLEDVYGLRLDLVAVTAAGGLVDVRFTVTDKDKALHVLHDAASMPELYVEASGALLRAPKPLAHKMLLLDGARYFVLYPNSGGAIQRGTSVSVVIDSVRSQPIVAES